MNNLQDYQKWKPEEKSRSWKEKDLHEVCATNRRSFKSHDYLHR